MSNKSIKWLLPVCLIGGAAVGGYMWLQKGIAPMPKGKKFYIRYITPMKMETVLAELKQKGVVKDPLAYKIYGQLKQVPSQVNTGTYELEPGMGAAMVYAALRKPVRQMVRIPETNWASRTSRLLETKYHVGQNGDYLDLVTRPEVFADDIEFPLPQVSLEGYLFPDTYDLPPLLTGREVIQRQLKAFDRKVWQGLNHPKDLQRLLIVASMVEMEAGTTADRAMIAGVIENRLKRGMRLQIDATILYGIQEWRRLTFADYRNQKTPYNTYLIDGLPPGPICSPSLASIKAAMNPAKHPYFFYVALPDGTTIYARDYEEHKANIRKRRKAIAALEKEKGSK